MVTTLVAVAAGIVLIAYAPRVLSRAPDPALPQVARVAVRPASPPPQVAAPGGKSIVGRLEKYDPATRQLVLSAGKSSLTFHVTADATIRQGSRRLKPEDLSAHRGDRVKLRYSESAGQRRADWIVVAPPPQPAKPAKTEPPKDTPKEPVR